MAKQGRQSQEKRFREKKKKENRQEKLDRRAQRKADKLTTPALEGGDIGSIADLLPTLSLPETPKVLQSPAKAADKPAS